MDKLLRTSVISLNKEIRFTIAIQEAMKISIFQIFELALDKKLSSTEEQNYGTSLTKSQIINQSN